MSERTRTNKRTGEVQAFRGGNWVTIRPGAPMSIQTRPADPTLPFKTTEAQNSAAASNYAPGKAQSDAEIARANAAYAAQRAQAEALRAQAEADKARIDAENAKRGDRLTQEQQAGKVRDQNITAAEAQIERVRELYKKEWKGGLPNWMADLIPEWMGGPSGAFDKASAGLASVGQAVTRIPGSGDQNAMEFQQFIDSNRPSPGDSDTEIEEKLRNIETRLSAFTGKQVKEVPYGGQQSDPRTLATNGETAEVDPLLQGVATRMGEMAARGAPGSKLMEFAKKNGLNTADPKLQQSIRGWVNYRKTEEGKNWMKLNPGKPFPVDPEFYTQKKKLSGVANIVNQAAQSGPGAGAVGFANAVSGNYLDNIVDIAGGNGEAVRTGSMALRSQSPGWSMAGDIAGQAGFEAIAGRVPGVRGLMASQWGRRGVDAAYGGVQGSGASEDGRLSGALGGAFGNAVGGMAGRRVHGATTGAIRGIRDQNLGYLHNAGVDLTPGRIARGSGGPVGGMLGGIEEKATSVPGVGDIINSARRAGDQTFNEAAFREMGGSGATGAAGIAEGQGLVNNAHGFLDNTNLPHDAQFAGRNAGVRSNLPNLPAFGNEIGTELNAIDRVSQGGVLPGRDWKSAISDVRGNRSTIAGQPFSRQAVGSMNEIESNLLDLAARQGPAGTIDNLNNANALNARFQTIASALDNGPAQKADELFSAGRLDDASRVNARNFGGRTASLSGNRPFYDLTTAGKAVMPNLTPDSGTAGRGIVAMGLAGAGLGASGGAYGADEGQAVEDTASGAAYGALPALALAGLYSAPVRRGLQNHLLGPRPRVDAIEQMLAANPRLRQLINGRAAGMFGGGMGRDFFAYPELPE